MFVKSTTCGKIITAQKGASNTNLSLTNLPIQEAKMAKKYFIISEVSFQPKPKSKRFLDIEDQRFGRLIVIGYAGKSRSGLTAWFCKCDCGKIVKTSSINLKSKHTKSCGCLCVEKAVQTNTIHGLAASKEYFIYNSARNRCQNTNVKSYPLYGGRGIEFRFNSFEEFFAVVGERPSPKHSLDRIDNNGHYEKGNVRWTTFKQQSRNRRTNRFIKHKNSTRCIAEWAEIFGLSQKTINGRLKRGWCEVCAITLPSGNKCCAGKK